MLISKETIQSVQNRMCIEEVIVDFIPLKKKGQNFWACCPFHQENTPSFSVSPTKGFYKCFGCDAAGDAITFIQQIENCSFVEAITYLAQKYSIAIVPAEMDNGTDDIQDYHTKEGLHVLLKLAADYFSKLLWTHTEAAQIALPYLEQRTIPAAIARKFSLGYSLNSWDSFYQFAIEKGISVNSLVTAGLVIQSDHKVYDRFRGRLMFPIHNSRGQVVAFGARRLVSTPTIESPKYINSPETAVYHKRTVLYGFPFARQQIKQENNCFLVEGYTDVLAFHKIGKEAVVAVSGTALTEEQIQDLRRLTTKVTLVFDGDQAGIQAALRSIDPLLAKGFEVKVVALPIEMDPDSYIRAVGSTAFIHYMGHSTQDFITFQAGILRNQTPQSPTEEAKSIRTIIQSIIAIPDEIEQNILLKKCSKLFAIDEAIIRTTYHTLRHQSAKQTTLVRRKKQFSQAAYSKQTSYVDLKKIPLDDKLTTSIEAYEREIMRILLSYGSTILPGGQRLYEYILAELGTTAFRSKQCQILLIYCREMLHKGHTIDLQTILDSGDPTMQKAAIDLTACRHEISEAWIKKYSIYTIKEVDQVYQLSVEVILRLKLRLVQTLMEENRAALKEECSITEEEQLLQMHQMLKATECSLAKRLGTVVAQ